MAISFARAVAREKEVRGVAAGDEESKRNTAASKLEIVF